MVRPPHADERLRLRSRAPRATWIQTELFLTFPTPMIRSITLIPLTTEETGGRFRVWLDLGDRVELIWDRKVSAREHPLHLPVFGRPCAARRDGFGGRVLMGADGRRVPRAQDTQAETTELHIAQYGPWTFRQGGLQSVRSRHCTG
jgi:hypothetical protein